MSGAGEEVGALGKTGLRKEAGRPSLTVGPLRKATLTSLEHACGAGRDGQAQ